MWIVNRGAEAIEVYIQAEMKFVTLRPSIPVNITNALTAVDILNRHRSKVSECTNPEEYFKDRPLSQLVIRDAGIGDLLLLEPVLRKLKASGNRELTVLTSYPEIYTGNPFIDACVRSKERSDLAGLDLGTFDQYDDMRSYSETSPTRAKKHRTDVYLEKFSLDLTAEEKEPRLYLDPKVKSKLEKKQGFRYIGVSIEATHRYRGVMKPMDIIRAIQSVPGNVVVLLGQVKEGVIPGAIDLRGETTIEEMLATVATLDAMVACDSGVMHVALTLHIPTVCIFTIITPDLRLRYYTGPREVIAASTCVGCGDFHMDKCRHDTRMDDFIPPCQRIAPARITEALAALADGKPIIRKAEAPKPVISSSGSTVTLCIIVQDEEHNLPRFVENVIKHPAIGRVIAIDGGSKDRTVDILKEAGVFVYRHEYDLSFPDIQAMQRNYSLSFCRNGEKVLIMDPDECFSDDLSEWLPTFARSNIVYGELSRRTFNFYADIKNSAKQIKNYPDWQPRLYTWDHRFKFVGSPHHRTLNVPPVVRVQKDIIHFEREGKDRDALEAKWATMWKTSKELIR